VTNQKEILKENQRRLDVMYAEYSPETGVGSPLKRFPLKIFTETEYWLPESMKGIPAIKQALEYDTAVDYVIAAHGAEDLPTKINDFYLTVEELRLKHDFEFWAFRTIKIEDKLSLQLIPFKLRGAQHKLLMSFESQRLKGIPIRTIVAKARQWGGSTLTQIYMFWIQQMHKTNWHSAVIAHLDDAAKNIRGMYSRAAKHYPADVGIVTLAPYEGSSKNRVCVETGGIMGVGSVQNPDQFHSYNYALAHLSECGYWGETTKKSATALVQALRPSVPNVPMSMIVIESTANGRGNFFHKEWVAATTGGSRYDAVFVAWYEIDLYQKPIKDYLAFLKKIDHHLKHKYFWSLWERGATLEGINWYMSFQEEENLSDVQMWRQFPSDAGESFSSTGRRVFSPIVLKLAERNCIEPLYKGQLFGKDRKGKNAFVDLEFDDTGDGELWIWDFPQKTPMMSHRYVLIADIGGKSEGADYSTIRVFDRSYILDGGVPEIVASWRGHLDQDLFAWVAVQLSFWYNKGLFIIESNSLVKELVESEGDHYLVVLDEIAEFYSNLYMRTTPEKIKEGKPIQWGFHTNKQTKPMVISRINAAFRDDGYVERDIRVINEADQFENKPDGTMGATDGTHDDLLIPTAIGVWASESEMPLPKIIKPSVKKSKGQRTEASL